MKQMKKILKDKKVLLLLIVLFLIIIGIIFIFINDNTKVDNNVSFKNLDKKEIKIEKVKNGYEFEKEIVVSNTTNKDVIYDLVWVDVDNEFKTQSDLLYSISSTGDGAVKVGTSQVPVVDSPIMTKIKLKKGLVHTYKLKIWYDKSKNSKDNDLSKFTGYVAAKMK